MNKTPPLRVTEVSKLTAATETEVNKINVPNKTSTSIANTHTAVPSWEVIYGAKQENILSRKTPPKRFVNPSVQCHKHGTSDI